MKLRQINGCSYYSSTIDGEELEDMNIEDVKRVVSKIINYSDIDDLRVIFEHILKASGKLISVEHCDTCGDSIVTYEMNINGLI